MLWAGQDLYRICPCLCIKSRFCPLHAFSWQWSLLDLPCLCASKLFYAPYVPLVGYVICCNCLLYEWKLSSTLYMPSVLHILCFVCLLYALKCKWHENFYCPMWKSFKNVKDCRLPFLNIVSSSRVINV